MDKQELTELIADVEAQAAKEENAEVRYELESQLSHLRHDLVTENYGFPSTEKQARLHAESVAFQAERQGDRF